ncbi:MAG: hypothetical protein ACKOBJ_01175 [Actinomycetota bacterium]
MGLLGWFVYAFGASLTLVRDDQEASRVAISVLSVSLALGGVVGSMLAPKTSGLFWTLLRQIHSESWGICPLVAQHGLR